jgi:signal transduction histidine kinase
MSRPAHKSGMSLSRRLLIGVLPAAVMFVVLMAFFTSARLEDSRRDLAESSQLFADSLAPALEYAVVSGNRGALEQVLRQSLRRSKAEWLRVTDVVGEEIGFVGNSTESGDRTAGSPMIYSAEILQEPVELSSGTDWRAGQWNFSTGSLRVGTLEVAVSPRILEERQQEVLWSSLSVGIAMLLFTMLLVNHFLSAIFRAISQLSGRVNLLMQGDYEEQPIETHGGGREIASIQQQLNQLALHLGQARESREKTLALSETAREKAEYASQAKSEFLAGMSQELRTPLKGVLGMIDLVHEEPLSKQQMDYLETARKSTQDLMTVISDMLDFAQIENGHFELAHQEFDLRNLISNCAASYRLAAEQQGLMLELHFQGSWPEKALVLGDSARVRQVLAGLLGNSLKYTTDGYISVRASWSSADGKQAVLNCTVSDSGSNSAGQRLNNLLPHYEQSLPGTATRMQVSSGLGLSMVQRLVELMGGHVQVDTDLGQGAYFRFDLPFQLSGED